MDLNYLRVFYEVAKAGRFTVAAKSLNISQSALSRSVALLEEDQGVKLFERSKQGVSLTPVGTEVFLHCESIFQTVQRIEGVCSGLREACEGPLRFATTDHVINDLLVRPLQAFRDEYPLVVPSISVGTPDEIIATLLNSSCEFGLMFARVTTPQIDYEAIREEPMALVVQAKIWKLNRSANHTATLNQILKKVGYISSIGAYTQSRPSQVLKELFGKPPPLGLEVNGQEPQKRICLAGGGVAYLARFMVEREIEAGLLHEINVEHPHQFNLWLATRKGKLMTVAAREFVARLRLAL